VNVERQRRDWDALAESDPLWAVLTHPDRRHGGWSTEEFFATGEDEIAELMEIALRLGRPQRRERALDFGCGVGRLTRALASRFEEVVGVDISPSMVEVGRRLNADVPGCRFVVNIAPDLSQLGSDSFDLVYSNLVLQHLPSPKSARAYVHEFLRLARDDGVAVFHLPIKIPWRYRLQPRRRLYAILRLLGVSEPFLLRRTSLMPMRMIAVRERVVREWIDEAGGEILAAEPRGDPYSGLRYYVAKSSA
jgi:SAM-dependent methyltransferase